MYFIHLSPNCIQHYLLSFSEMTYIKGIRKQKKAPLMAVNFILIIDLSSQKGLTRKSQMANVEC